MVSTYSSSGYHGARTVYMYFLKEAVLEIPFEIFLDRIDFYIFLG